MIISKSWRGNFLSWTMACGKLMSCPKGGSYRWFRLKDQFFDHAACAEPDHHRHPQVTLFPQTNRSNHKSLSISSSGCRITGFTILLTAVGISHTFANRGDPPWYIVHFWAPHVEATLRSGGGWANAAYRHDTGFGNRGGGAAREGLTTRPLAVAMASCLLHTPSTARKKTHLLVESSWQDLEFAKNRAIDKLCLGRYGRLHHHVLQKGRSSAKHIQGII